MGNIEELQKNEKKSPSKTYFRRKNLPPSIQSHKMDKDGEEPPLLERTPKHITEDKEDANMTELEEGIDKQNQPATSSIVDELILEEDNSTCILEEYHNEHFKADAKKGFLKNVDNRKYKEVDKFIPQGMHKRSKTIARKEKTNAEKEETEQGREIYNTLFEAKEENNEVEMKKKKKRNNKEIVVVDTDSDDDYAYEKDEVDKKDVNDGRTLNQRIPPSQFMELLEEIKRKNEIDKMNAIREIGFGGLLELSLPPHDSKFAAIIVKAFDVDTGFLLLPRNQAIEILVEDVHLVYGLPMVGDDIFEPQSEDYDDKWNEFLKEWRNYWKVSCSTTNKPMVSWLKNAELDDNWIRNFVMCAVNCCMRSTQNTSMNFKFLYSIIDVSRIKHLNWCKFVLKSLLECSHDWKSKCSRYYTGPLPFLMICYFDRLKRQLMEAPRYFPLTSVWKKERIQQRLDLEKTNGFGKGIVVERMCLPNSIVARDQPSSSDHLPSFGKSEGQVQEHQEQQNLAEMGDVQKQNSSRLASSSSSGTKMLMDFLNRFGNLVRNLALNCKELSAMIDEAGTLFPGQEMVEQINVLVTSLLGKLTMQQQSSSNLNRSPSILSQDQHLFADETFMAAYEEFEKKAYEQFKGKKKKTMESMTPPSFNLLSPENSQVEPCTPLYAPESPWNPDKEFNTDMQTAIQRSLIETHHMPKNTKESLERGSDVCHNDSRPRRYPQNLPSCFRSPFMANYGKLFKNMHTLKNIVADYAFSEGQDDEVLYDDGQTTIDRDVMSSLASYNPIFNYIIDAWANIMNTNNKSRRHGSPNRLFFTTHPFVLICTDEYYLKAEPHEKRLDGFITQLNRELDHYKISDVQPFQMVFFPVALVESKHYYIICINMISRTVDLIDHNFLEKGQSFSSKYHNYPKKVLRAYVSFLSSKGFSNLETLESFPTRTLKLKWRSNSNNYNGGVFLMKHMETYQSQNDTQWECELNAEDIDNLSRCRAEYCGAILMHNANKLHDLLVVKAKKWRSEQEEPVNDID